MTTQPSTAPVRTSVVVDAPVERAFEVFTTHFDSWWPREHKIGSGALREAIMEPRDGGRWFERGEDGGECEWGKVLRYEPPHRVVLAWQIDHEWHYDAELVTEVEVRFSAESDGRTRVELEHRDLDRFGAAAETMRGSLGSDGGWTGLLVRFAAAAAGG
jgi:uncharacterized protein YndB with AHSA1/START domain